jgi:hypothetical protein
VLHFVPLSSKKVVDDYLPMYTSDGMLAMVQETYRKHGWPDLKVYRKKECLEAVLKAIRERYPDAVLGYGIEEEPGSSTEIQADVA